MKDAVHTGLLLSHYELMGSQASGNLAHVGGKDEPFLTTDRVQASVNLGGSKLCPHFH